jgi:hypothetical protein
LNDTTTKPAKAAKAKAAPAQPPAGEESIVTEPAPGEVEGAIERLGTTIADQERKDTAGLDLSEGAHTTAIERMEQNATDATVDSRSLVPDVRDFILQTIKDRPKPWAATSNAEQRDVAAAVEHAATELVRKVIEAVRSAGSVAPIRCLLIGYADKGDDVKIDMKLKVVDPADTTKAIVALHEAKGKHVLVTVASVDDFRTDGREAELDDDEPPLNFEAGHPGDDSDLAGETCPPMVTTGDTVDGVEFRVNLKTEMVEALPEGCDRDTEGDWTDERPATPEELAGERQRVADFDDEDGSGEE